MYCKLSLSTCLIVNADIFAVDDYLGLQTKAKYRLGGPIWFFNDSEFFGRGLPNLLVGPRSPDPLL